MEGGGARLGLRAASSSVGFGDRKQLMYCCHAYGEAYNKAYGGPHGLSTLKFQQSSELDVS